MTISTPLTIFSIGNIPISNTIIFSWIIMGLLLFVFIIMGRNLKVKAESKVQLASEALVETILNLTKNTMGEKKVFFAPYFFALGAFLLISNLSGFVFLGIVRPPTADLVTTLSLALLTFFLTQGFAIKSKGIKGYLKSFLDPLPFMLPLNLISELANPISLSFRLFGNLVGGLIITSLFYGLLISNKMIALLIFAMGVIINIVIYFDIFPKINNKFFKRLGILLCVPMLFVVFIHFYFDLFSGALQTFIFMMLSMMFISMAMD